MSGTSLDGIDASLVDLRPAGSTYAVKTLRSITVPFDDALAKRLQSSVPPASPSPSEVAALDRLLGWALGDAAASVCAGTSIDFVASHGLTLFHDGSARTTWQIGDPFAIRERTGATVLFDFRRADCAAGGQGAPLVPFVDALLFASPQRSRAALNLGGIANVTLLARGALPAEVLAWDVGPANILIDGFVKRKTGGRERWDRDGRYASRGTIDRRTLDALLADPYFAKAPPKSTGREYFGDAFLSAHADALDPLSIEDGCATLVALTAESVANAIGTVFTSGEVVVSGGGARNPSVMSALADRLAGFDVFTSARLGIDPDAKEAIAFAILGYELLRGRPAGMPSVTGAARPAVLGAIAPTDLDGLLRRVHEEVGGAK